MGAVVCLSSLYFLRVPNRRAQSLMIVSVTALLTFELLLTILLSTPFSGDVSIPSARSGAAPSPAYTRGERPGPRRVTVGRVFDPGDRPDPVGARQGRDSVGDRTAPVAAPVIAATVGGLNRCSGPPTPGFRVRTPVSSI